MGISQLQQYEDPSKAKTSHFLIKVEVEGSATLADQL